MNNELVSVIIPTYGGGKCLERAVKSVLKQTYRNIEVIVVDDNGQGTPSQEETQKVMGEFKNYGNVFYVIHEVNRNGSVARNTGFKHSHGDYISLLDDDDEFTATKIENLLEVLSNLPADYGLAFGNARGYDGDKEVYYNKAHITENPLYDILLHHFSIGTSAFLMRRAVYERVGGFDEEFLRHQDWEFFCKVIANYKVIPVDTDVSVRHLTRRNSPRLADTIVKYRSFYLKKMQPYIEILPIKMQKDVLVYNMMDVYLKYLSEKRYKLFIRSYLSLKPGWRGIRFLMRRVSIIIKRGSLKGKE